MTSFHISERIMIKVNGTERLICPKCKNHKQITDTEFSELPFEEARELDRKNTFYELNKEGKQVCRGQCCCYSLSHKEY